MQNLERLRGFKVETLQATDTKPARIKLTDLRFSKAVFLNYGAKQETLIQVITEFLQSKGIEISAQLWAEDKKGIHQYGIYLTSNFSNQIN